MATKTEGVLQQLGDRARRLAGQRPPLPDRAELARFVWLCFGEQASALLAEMDAAGSLAPVVGAVEALSLPEAGEALRGAVLGAINAVLGRDRKACGRSLEVVEAAMVAFSLTGDGRWWERGTIYCDDETAAYLASGGLTALDAAGYLLGSAHLWPREEAKPASLPEAAPAATALPVAGDPGEGALVAAAEPTATQKPTSCEVPGDVAALLDAVEAVSEEPAAAEEVEVVVRRPGDPPVRPAGSRYFGSIEEWVP